MKRFSIIFLGIVALLMSSCYSHRVIGYLQEPTKSNKLPVYDSVPYVPYRLRVNDEILYRVISMDENIFQSAMSQSNSNYTYQYANSYRIQQDGTVDLPFLKPVHIAGLTEQEAQEAVLAAYQEVVPDASVKLVMYNKFFSVIGDARSGQYYIYKEKLNIFQALAMTGDVMNSGDRRHIRIIRQRELGEEPLVLEFDIRTNTIINSEYYYIYPNDVIYVARTRDSFYKVPSYTGFLSLITSSVALLTTVLNYLAYLYK